jgi:hypothetical protein
MSTLGGRVGNTLLLILHLDDMRLKNEYHTQDLKRIFTSLINVTINAVSESTTELAFTRSARQSFGTPVRFALSPQRRYLALKFIGPWHS